MKTKLIRILCGVLLASAATSLQAQTVEPPTKGLATAPAICRDFRTRFALLRQSASTGNPIDSAAAAGANQVLNVPEFVLPKDSEARSKVLSCMAEEIAAQIVRAGAEDEFGRENSILDASRLVIMTYKSMQPADWDVLAQRVLEKFPNSMKEGEWICTFEFFQRNVTTAQDIIRYDGLVLGHEDNLARAEFLLDQVRIYKRHLPDAKIRAFELCLPDLPIGLGAGTLPWKEREILAVQIALRAELVDKDEYRGLLQQQLIKTENQHLGFASRIFEVYLTTIAGDYPSDVAKLEAYFDFVGSKWTQDSSKPTATYNEYVESLQPVQE